MDFSIELGESLGPNGVGIAKVMGLGVDDIGGGVVDARCEIQLCTLVWLWRAMLRRGLSGRVPPGLRLAGLGTGGESVPDIVERVGDGGRKEEQRGRETSLL